MVCKIAVRDVCAFIIRWEIAPPRLVTLGMLRTDVTLWGNANSFKCVVSTGQILTNAILNALCDSAKAYIREKMGDAYSSPSHAKTTNPAGHRRFLMHAADPN